MQQTQLASIETTLEEAEYLKNTIHIKGANSNNLKNIELLIPKNQKVYAPP